MIVSNSEVDSYLGCKRAHYYRFALGLSPKGMSRALHTGLLGHAVLEAYYNALKETSSTDDAFEAGMGVVAGAFAWEDAEIVNVIMNRYIEYVRYWSDHWRVISVEGVYKVPLTDHLEFGMTADLVVEYLAGPYKGQLVVIDHKFRYNFPSPDELSMHVQLPKYIWGLRQLGYPVRFAMMNVLRYREGINDVDKLYRRYEIRPTEEHLKRIMAEHLAVAEEIYAAKTQPVNVYANKAHRRLDMRVCAGCYFRVPCRQDLMGVDESRTLASMFTPGGNQGPYKAYGY
jgi:CRISPR/Cas system-associated exonuclease Cas4 (RecB family)